MRPCITLIDAGIGNFGSLISALEFVGYDVSVARAVPRKCADRILLPGVGNFGAAINKLRSNGFCDYVLEHTVLRQRPLLGICVGMQVLFEGSDESREMLGFGLFDGVFNSLASVTDGLRVPHVGFNSVRHNESGIFANLAQDADFYFTHSYFLPSRFGHANSGITSYGCDFVSAYVKDQIASVQFHPEKSQSNGLKLLANFATI